MVANRTNEFKHLSIITMNTDYGAMYQLRLSSRLGRKTIGLGSDKIQALNLALMVDEEIEKCIINDQVIEIDYLKALVKNAQNAIKVKKNEKLRIVEKDDLTVLWSKYVSFHTSIKAWEQTYILTTIQTVSNIVKRCPFQRLEQKNELVEWLFSDEKRSPKTNKDRLKLIVAAIDWNSKQGNIPRKWGIEYRDLLESISVKTDNKRSVNCEEDDIDIFTVKEIYQILDALKNETYSRLNGKHYQYFKYVYFCWLTGCRPSEAIALKWENVDLQKKRIKFCEAQVNASGRIIKKKGTKTVPVRYFPINEELMELLDSIPYKTDYVFINVNGKPIAQQALNGVWKNLLEAMGIRYRVPYQLRHTMISYHANNDYPIHKLAELVGNSEKVIKEHYLKLDIERISLPDIIRK
ncbi:tyrosine-type recombinase/integrase [Iningainema tapete]|uniref:Site-specific integrase n=1 Tax=Iningainema tapete BLCC-T55 TaxID=2748662 RepID=A0A8J7BZX0_9CYAN|nr:site-specific integrase [Iningainema tapete]MBD2776898.1 site-specific integrase [Iningainema tapete BLCC-T55]